MNWFRKKKKVIELKNEVPDFTPIEGVNIAKLLNDLILDYRAVHPSKDPFDYILGIAMDSRCYLQLKSELKDEELTHFMQFPIGICEFPGIALIQSVKMAGWMEQQRQESIRKEQELLKEFQAKIRRLVEAGKVVSHPGRVH